MRKKWRLTKPLRARIRAGHPWIYDRAIAPPTGLAAGDLATLVDDDGPLATVFADPGSPIRARILDLDPDAAIDGAWVRGRAEAASQRRARDPLLRHQRRELRLRCAEGKPRALARLGS